MREVTQPWSVSVPAQLAGIAALQDEAYKTRSLLLLAQEKVAMHNQLQQLGFKLFGSRANYIFFQSSIGLYEFCLKRGVLIRDCSNYKGLSEGFYRIAVRQQKDNQVLLGILKEWQKWQNRL
jgi:threonine-phosphate decarboxylase